MILGIEFFIALKQLKAKIKQTILAITTVAVGVMILICALSLTNGFEKDLVDKILGNNPHITIESAMSDRIHNYKEYEQKLTEIEGVKSATSMIRGQALLNNGIEVRGVLINGVDIDKESEKSDIKKNIVKGQLLKDENSIVLGYELAQRMGLILGDNVQVVTGVGMITPMIVTGIFKADFYEIDVRIAYINLTKAQKIYNLANAVNTISVKVDTPFLADEKSEVIAQKIPSFNSRSWLKDNRALLSAMALEKKVIFIVIMFIIIVAMIGISNLLVMIVIEKNPEIGILRSIGASKKSINRIFFYQGVFIGIIGIIFGIILGYMVSLILSKYPINLPNDVYIISNLPIDMQVQDFIFVSIAAFVVCVLSSIIPARRAVKMNPVEAIRKGK
ncbi:MAG: ABC transporter permease [Candidatus Sericytochromatia bacterium]